MPGGRLLFVGVDSSGFFQCSANNFGIQLGGLLSSVGGALRSYIRSAVYGFWEPPSFRAHEPHAKSTHALWPMAPPYKDALGPFRRQSVSASPGFDTTTMSVDAMVNLQVMILSWLRLGRPAVAPLCARSGNALSELQLCAVQRFHSRVAAWRDAGLVTAQDLGRAGTKYANIVNALSGLQSLAVNLRRTLDPYAPQIGPGSNTILTRGYRTRDHETRVVGFERARDCEIAKDVEPSRLTFKGGPSLDPSLLYPPELKTAYLQPSTLSVAADGHPPRVRFRGSRRAQRELYRLLDDTGRLVIVDSSIVGNRPRSGFFNVLKNADKDRLIMDSRPPNFFEAPVNIFTKLLATAMSLTGLYVPPDRVIAIYGFDLTDYYYQFIISRERALRNAIVGNWPAKHFLDFKSFNRSLLSCRSVCVCLNTMAMGDHNSVEFGQAAHLTIALLTKSISLSEIVYHHSRPPRGFIVGGVIQDDFGLLELEPCNIVDGIRAPMQHVPPFSKARDRLRRIQEGYRLSNLIMNDSKAVSRSFSDTLWGGFIDGIAGTVQAPRTRTIALASITFEVVRLGFVTVGLLEVLNGSWISVLMYRKRMLCLMDLTFVAVKGRRAGDVLLLSSALKAELFVIATLAPLAVTNLRARPHTQLSCVDASNRGIAHVATSVEPSITLELYRHTLTKGSWTRLLCRSDRWLREHHILDEQHELPDHQLTQQQLWNDVAQCYDYHVVKAVRLCRREHINLSETKSILLTEEAAAAAGGELRQVVLGDSQVAASAVAKGRSSSAALNDILSTGLPNVLGADLYTGLGWIPSAINPSDDPTRGVALRKARVAKPRWLTLLEGGDFGGIDEIAVYEPGLQASLDAAAAVVAAKRSGVNPLWDRLSAVGASEDPEVRSNDALFGYVDAGEQVRAPLDVSAPHSLYGHDRIDRLDNTLGHDSQCEVGDVNVPVLADLCAGGDYNVPVLALAAGPAEVPSCPGKGGWPELATLARRGGLLRSSCECNPLGPWPARGAEFRCRESDPSFSLHREKLVLVKMISSYLDQVSTQAAAAAEAPCCVADNDKGADLPSEIQAALRSFELSQFVRPKLHRGASWEPRQPGALCLYSGSRRYAKRLLARGAPWVLTVDAAHGPGQDLLEDDLRRRLEWLVVAGAFRSIGAQPPCSSFSTAVTPPVRSSAYPGGYPWLSEGIRRKVREGNSHSAWVLHLVMLRPECCSFWVENPFASWLWKNRPWRRFRLKESVCEWKFDQCRFGTPWRKRTRIVCNLTSVGGQETLCCGGHGHTLLRGRSPAGIPWTKEAEAYPLCLADVLAWAVAAQAGWCGDSPLQAGSLDRACARRRFAIV